MATMNGSNIFNSPIELGLRALILLAEAYPKPLDLQRLVVLDYLLVHSGDVENGPESIHPPSPMRAGEISIRRGLIEDGLHLFAIKGLVAYVVNESGISYQTGDHATIFLDAFNSDYFTTLRNRANWAIELAGGLSDTEAAKLLEQTVGKWRTEFIAEELEAEYEH